MPRRRGSRKKRDDAWIAWLAVLVAIAFVGLLIVSAASAFWNALMAFDPAAVATVVVVLLLMGGGVGWFVYRRLIRRERRLAAQRLTEQENRDRELAALRYKQWLRSADMAALDRMSGIEFEHALAELFTDLGYGAVVTQASHDYGADLVLSRGAQKVVVQAKRYVGTLGLDAVQQASAARLHYGAVRAIVVTTSDFTTPARTLAQTTGVELWDRMRLNEEMSSVAERSLPTPQHVVAASNENGDFDPLFARAARAVAAERAASVSLLQRKFSVDNLRAARILDELEQNGVVAAYRGSTEREVLMDLLDVDDLLERLGIE